MDTKKPQVNLKKIDNSSQKAVVSKKGCLDIGNMIIPIDNIAGVVKSGNLVRVSYRYIITDSVGNSIRFLDFNAGNENVANQVYNKIRELQGEVTTMGRKEMNITYTNNIFK